jgi:hypothetical protein
VSAEGDTAQCKNCPEIIVWRDNMAGCNSGWYHSHQANWPTREHVNYVRHCPNPHNPAVAEPVEQLIPQNYDEIEACIAIVWGEEGNDCNTKVELRAKCEARIKEMRTV